MTLSDTFTGLADGFRDLYGTTGKYKLSDMIKGLKGLEIKNYIHDGQVFVFDKPTTQTWFELANDLTVDTWNKYIKGKDVTFSFDVEWSGNHDSQKKLGVEIQTTDINGNYHWNNAWFWPPESSGKKHFSQTWSASDVPIKSIDSFSAYYQLDTTSTGKLTNFKMVVNPMGGEVAPLGLFNPDLSKWFNPGIQLISQDGYQVAILPPDSSQLQTNPSWLANKSYHWTFEAKAEQPGDAIHTEAWGGIGFADFSLTSKWKEYSTTGTINPLHGDLYFWNASANKNIYIRNIKIYEV